MRTYFKPELATLVESPPNGHNWIHEIKFDGYRILSRISPDSIMLLTRNGKNWADHFPSIVRTLASCPFKNTILDGELVVLDNAGRSRFQLLQNAINEKKSGQVHYFVFDIPYCKGENLDEFPLYKRKAILKTVFKQWKPKKNILLTQYIQGHGALVHTHACKNQLEGIISKEISSHYEQKRSKHWLKVKCGHRQEFIIIGFTPPRRSRSYFGALLLAVYQGIHLTYCGRVGTGFNADVLKSLYKKMRKIEVNTCPLHFNVPQHGLKDIHWVKPQLIGEVAFTEWTQEGLLRHPSFLGLRFDKEPNKIKREQA